MTGSHEQRYALLHCAERVPPVVIDESVVLALDVGGTKALGALVRQDGSLVCSRQLPTGGLPGKVDPGLRIVCQLTRELLAMADERQQTITALGAGFPEYVFAGQLCSQEVLDWDGQPAQLLADIVDRDVPITIESDVRCAALAEARTGAGRGYATVAYVSWGTGLSWTLVQAGTPLAGRRGEAIGLGECCVSSRVAPEWSGNLEQFASGKGIGLRYSALTGLAAAGARAVQQRADSGDAIAAQIIEQAAWAIGDALAWLVALIDPDVVVLGGGIGMSDTKLCRRAMQRCLQKSSVRANPPALLHGALAGHAGVLGAALMSGKIGVDVARHYSSTA